ncbi:RNA 2',3'-cyclic phosphodiesterase [Paraglaciecola aestuariivivens]
MRAFFAISVEPKVKLAIESWRDKALPPLDHPVAASNFHITLAFLGQVTNKHLDSLEQGIENMAAVQSFAVQLTHLGYWAKPKALWLGCQQVDTAHSRLAKQLQAISKKAGLVMPQQDYVAHLTLARKCQSNPPAALIEPDFSWQVAHFHLFESVSTPTGVSYQIRKTWPLAPKFAW